MRIALDSNILVYAEAVHDADRGARARTLITRLRLGATFVAVQALGEVFNVLTRKAGRTPAQAQLRIAHWLDLFDAVPTSLPVLAAALDLAAASKLCIWDAVNLAAAASAHCEVFLSEDMQHGFRWRGVTVVNPFADPPHPLLAALLD